MEVLCVGSSFLTYHHHRNSSRKASPNAEASRFSAHPLSRSSRPCPRLHCTDPFKPTPSPPEEVQTPQNTQNSNDNADPDSTWGRIETSFGKLFRGRLWFFILLLLLTASGVAYSYLVYMFADVADVPILGVTRK